jgi:hypothetical protein
MGDDAAVENSFSDKIGEMGHLEQCQFNTQEKYYSKKNKKNENIFIQLINISIYTPY